MARSKDKTKKALLDAIDRIKRKAYTCQELRKKSIVKLNRSNVEKEAGLSSGALRHHSDIVEIILSDEDDKAKISRLEKELEQSKAKIKKLEFDNSIHKRSTTLDSEALNEQLSAYHQTIAALFFKIPLAEREGLMSKLDDRSSNVSGSVTNINAYRRGKE
ncbi:hypothetical protein [Vibrio campbellii]|uniref:hypothetical protein n=1 Tax=Vibrio campbellii TaxID=680 RepID=UPI0005EFB4FA|nr:hypothetical protein [Vibrio campbellii]